MLQFQDVQQQGRSRSAVPEALAKSSQTALPERILASARCRIVAKVKAAADDCSADPATSPIALAESPGGFILA
jgi:hypothetical protein